MNKKIGFIMWFLIIITYTLFIVNWIFGGQLVGNGTSAGIAKDLLDRPIGVVENQATNYLITFGRGVGSLLIGVAVARFGHKKATIIAFSLIMFSIIAVLIPNYHVYVVLRSLFAIGGTTLIILIQPIIATYFDSKGKAKLSLFSTLGYPLGVVVSILPFIPAFKVVDSIRENWKYILLGISLVNIIPFALYIIYGQAFDRIKQTTKQQVSAAESSQEEVQVIQAPQATQEVTFKSVLKEKETWYWILFYGLWLIVAVMPLLLIRPGFSSLIGLDNKAFAEIYGNKIIIWLVMYHIPIVIGPFTVGLWNRFSARRKPYIVAVLTSALVFWILSFIIFRYGVLEAKEKFHGLDILFYILGFLGGLACWGIQGVFLNNPHEKENKSAKKINILFSIIWGGGYFVFTILNIVLALILDAGSTGGIVWMVLMTLLFAACPVSWLLMKETKKDGKLLPSMTELKNAFKKN